MPTHLEKSITLAGKISAKAEDALARLDAEMRIMQWPAEFQAIMWEAVADAATIRARFARDPQ